MCNEYGMSRIFASQITNTTKNNFFFVIFNFRVFVDKFLSFSVFLFLMETNKKKKKKIFVSLDF